MSLLDSLPTEVCHSILDEWLSIKQWGLLDISVSERQLRPGLLEQFKLLSNKEMSDKEEYDSSMFEWICARSIKLKYLNVNSSMLNSNGLKTSLNLESVFNLYIWSKNEDGATRLVNQCKSLRQLRVEHCGVILRMDPDICSKLTSIFISNGSKEHLTYIRDTCTMLKTFKYLRNIPENYDVLLEIIQRNPTLEHLQFFGDANVLSTIRHHCKHLKSLVFHIVNISLHDINDLLAENPCLELFVFKTNFGRSTTYDARTNYLYIRDYDDDIDELVRFLGYFRGLKHIDFDGLYNLVDKVIDVIIARNASTLRRFVIGVCGGLTAPCLKNLLLRCSVLKEVIAYHGALTHDEVISIFCDDIPNKLSYLIFQGGNNMKVPTLVHVLKACKHLEYCQFRVLYYADVEKAHLPELEKLRKTKVSVSTGKQLKLETY